MIFPYRYAWRLRALWGGHDSPWFNQRCRVLARAGEGKNARLIEVESGLQIVTSGNALRRLKA